MSDDKVPELDEIPELPDPVDLPDDIPDLPDEAAEHVAEPPDDIPELPDEPEAALEEIPVAPPPVPVRMREPPRHPASSTTKEAPRHPTSSTKEEAPGDPTSSTKKEAPRHPTSSPNKDKASGGAAEDAAARAAAAATAAAATAAGAAASVGSDDPPPLRTLDKAPTHLRKAAVFVVAGSLLPWIGGNGSWLTTIAAKLLIFVGVWCWLQQVNHNWGPRLKGLLGTLAELDLRPKKKESPLDEKLKDRRGKREGQQPVRHITHPFPTALHTVSLLVIVGAVLALPFFEPNIATEENPDGAGVGKLIAELGMLAWGAYTWVHIHAYERWGHFNPLFPLMFIGMLIGGAAQVIFNIGDLGTFPGIAGVIGGGIIAFGGGLAAYTIFEAMRDAKREGDIKKQAQIEARKEAREKRKEAADG